VILVVGNLPITPVGIPTMQIGLRDQIPAGGFVAVMFDLRIGAVADFSVLRENVAISDLPLLLLSDLTIPESAILLLRANDTFVFGITGGPALERRLTIFLELGRARNRRADQERFDVERQRFERLAAMGTMVAGFAHEVRNPVAALRSLCEELRDEGLTLPHVGLMLQMVERIERLVRTSLQFGRPAAPKRSPRSPTAIVASALSELRPRLRTHADIPVEADAELPDVNVDDRQLAQALVILLNNALDATSGTPSRVLLRVRKNTSTVGLVPGADRAQPTIRFEVIDDGPGISAANLGRIFDPFFTTKTSGTGLGLSIAQQIVSENGARLEVESNPGGRTAFTIVLPVDPVPEKPAERRPDGVVPLGSEKVGAQTSNRSTPLFRS
jgi:signal transduction histidine kinase